MRRLKYLLVFSFIVLNEVKSHTHLDWDTRHPTFGNNQYEDALDPEVCEAQLAYIRSNNTLLRMRFLESGMRFPRGLTQGNFIDMGIYPHCVNINQDIGESVIEGKYCMINGPVVDDMANFAANLGYKEWEDFDEDEYLRTRQKYAGVKELVARGSMFGQQRTIVTDIARAVDIQMAVCVPKACTIQEGLNGLLFNVPSTGLIQFEERFCRFKEDKLWAPIDYVAITIFSIIGLLTILSTGYDVWHRFVAKNDPKTMSTLYASFSAYTNAIRLTTFKSNHNNLECVDGIRSLATFWVIVGHTYGTLPPVANQFVQLDWFLSIGSLWITAAPYTVDTFFMLSGMLVVYTSIGKMSGMKLLKNVHLFYLNRILRMLPLLAAVVLFQASIINRLSDGPDWGVAAFFTDLCRTYWWTTLLYVQNFVNSGFFCIQHSWYLAIDMHCYLVSPLILYWLLNNNKTASWIALTAALLVSLTLTTTYTVINQFQGWMYATSRPGASEYMMYYYFNTYTRTPPFFIGMIVGYVLHLWKGKKIQIPWYLTVFLWICSIASCGLLMYVTHFMKTTDWEYWVVDDLLNSFGRSIWSLAIGWIVFACHYGLGGPINWILSHSIWKLPSRISYALYLFHYPLQFMLMGTAHSPIYFSDAAVLYEFARQMTVFFIVSFVVTIVIDAPFMILFKILLGGGPKAPKKEK